ncbi:MAG: hypothetical protein MI975_07315 [Cytophagales bacterium]|nr:hypothetical protein [Cytophagales bacterium]
MPNKINRRSFLTHTACVMGVLAGDPTRPFITAVRAASQASKTKKLLATTDFIDNVLINHRGSRYGSFKVRSAEYYDRNKCYMDRAQLDQLHKFLASVGVTRHQWMVDTTNTLYENYPHGFDLLAEVVRSAHAHGIELYAEIKPFEGGGFGTILPHSMPLPDNAIAFKDLRGIFPEACPFVVKNRHMNLKRRAGTYDSHSPVSSIRLVKSDDHPTRIKAEHLSIRTSPSNNGFVPYEGPVIFRETIEKRYRFPYWRSCRVLHLEGLDIPKDHRYFLIRCSLADETGDFSNENGNIIEAVGADGKNIPLTLSTGPVCLESHYDFYHSKVMKQLVRYLQLPEVQAEISDAQKMKEHYRHFYSFGEYSLADWTTLDKDGYVAVACGKPEYMTGNLHPIYPEVRAYWLELTRFCLDRGVDGINFRVANHTRSPEHWEYGFNEPTVEAAGGKTDYPTISRINGNAYTGFLREARKLIKERDKSLTVHLTADMFMPDNRSGKLNALPPNFDWQWETWVREIADDLEFRGIFKLRPWYLKQALDTFSAVARAANKPLYFQGDFHGMTFDGPFYSMQAEVDLVNNHAGLDGYVLYETANFTRIKENGELEGSTEVAHLLNKHFFHQRK